jgi:hypothetical protein
MLSRALGCPCDGVRGFPAIPLAGQGCKGIQWGSWSVLGPYFFFTLTSWCRPVATLDQPVANQLRIAAPPNVPECPCPHGPMTYQDLRHILVSRCVPRLTWASWCWDRQRTDLDEARHLLVLPVPSPLAPPQGQGSFKNRVKGPRCCCCWLHASVRSRISQIPRGTGPSLVPRRPVPPRGGTGLAMIAPPCFPERQYSQASKWSSPWKNMN